MSLLDYEVVRAEFSEAKQYKLKFQHSESTDLCDQPTAQPVFQNKIFQSSIKHNNNESPNFSVSLISISDGKEAAVDEIAVHLPLSREFVSHTITFSKANGSSVDGEIAIRYKSTKASLVQALRSEQIYCISIQAAHLNTLVETPFELKLNAKSGNQELSEAVVINNAKPNTHISLNDHIDVLNGGTVQLVITDNTNAHMYRVTVTPASPMVVTIPMKIGDPMVLTLQCMYLNEPKAKMVTGTVHTSFMREASISQTPGSTARKISLSPRRTTSFDQSAAAVGLLGTGQAIASTKKTLLFLEDSTLAAKSTPNSAIIGGIQSAEQINSLGEVVSSRPVENHHEAYLTELSTKILGRDSQGKHVGPTSGAYIVCNSKSEMLTSDLGKKTHKKQSLSINLGLMQVAQSGLTGPVRIRAKLVDLVFNAIHEEDEGAAHAGPDDADNPESTAVKGPVPEAEKKTRHQQRALIAYIGILEETSRELFNETGLVACTLEGKLFKPTAIQQSASEAMSAAANTIEGVGLADGEEACIAVKLYVSLVPSKTETVEQDADSDAESELGGAVEHTDSATDLKKLRKQARGANGELSKQPSVLDYEGLDKEILHSRRASGDVPSFRTDQAFNVVTKETALPGELAGSSVLSVPSSRQTASELLSRVPPLDLHGDHDKPRRARGAFGENLNAVQVVRGEANKRQLAEHETATTGAAFAKLVSAELDKKQKMIEDLLEDVKIRSEAIQVCGFDIRALREEQIRLNTKIVSMEQEKEQKAAEELKADAATSEILKYPHLMHELDKPALIRNMHKLREKIQALDKDRTALQDALTHAKDLVHQFAVLKKEHHNLQEAHMQQTKFLQKMQGKINQVAAFQETIKTQEKIISKMQSIVEAKMRSKNALPFLPKQPIPVPAPQEEKFHPPDLPDFEALQAQKVNEEELLQARQEIGELNEKVQDLERQLFEAKLDAMNAASGDAGSDSEGEEGGPDLSSLKEEQTDEQKANFENLKGANERIDQLEAESTSKSYRISALEEQLEASTRDYSREIARLRTKLFELEITAAMASDDRGSSAGSDGFMDDMDFDKLMNIQDPSQPTRRPSMSNNNSARRGIADSPMASAAPTPSASQQKIPPLGLDGASSRPSSVATGSARAAVHALKSNAPTTQSSPNKPEAESEVFDGEKLEAAAKALESTEDAEESASQSPKPSDTPSGGPLLSPKASKEQLLDKTDSAAPSRTASVDKSLNAAGEKTEDKQPEVSAPSAENTDHHDRAEALHVPKFRKTSKAGFGPAGPQDPEAVDKVVELAFEIIDSDQVSPRAEATIRTRKDNKIVMAMLNVKVHYHYDHVRKLSTFTIQHIKLHGFSQDLLQDRFEPYLKLSYGDKWKCVTTHAKSAGQTAEWSFNPSDAFFDKMFKVTDDEMAVEANSEFRCVVKKKNVKGHEDFECGDGMIVFTPKLFNPED